MAGRASTTFTIVTIIKNRLHLYEDLCSVRKKMKILDQKHISLCYNSTGGAPSKTEIHIYIRICGFEAEETLGVNGFMEFMNGCAPLFRLPPTTKKADSWTSRASTPSIIPYPNSSSINTVAQLLATKTNGFNIDVEVFQSPTLYYN